MTDYIEASKDAIGYMGLGVAVILVWFLVLSTLGGQIGPVELFVLSPLWLLGGLWLTIGVIAKGVEVGRRASRDD